MCESSFEKPGMRLFGTHIDQCPDPGLIARLQATGGKDKEGIQRIKKKVFFSRFFGLANGLVDAIEELYAEVY